MAVVEYLVEHGASMETQDKYGRTPLHWAAGGGHTAMVEYLVGEGANIEAKDESGQTAYDLAVENDETDIADFLSSVEAMGGSAAYRVGCNWKRRNSLVKWRMAFVGPL